MVRLHHRVFARPIRVNTGMSIARGPRGLMRVAASMLAMLIVELPMPKAYAQTTSQSGQQQPSDSQAALSARIDAAYGLMMDAGRFDEGYAQLRAALLSAARSDLY